MIFYAFVEGRHTLNVYEIFKDNSKRLLDNDLMEFAITSGNSLINISRTGEITARKTGTAIVSAVYRKNDMTFEADAMIRITGDSDGDLDTLSLEDRLIIEAYKKIKNEDGSVTVVFDPSGMVKENGKVKASISAEEIEKAFDKAVEGHNGKKRIILEFPEDEADNGYQLEIPKRVLQSTEMREIMIKTTIGNILLPYNMLGEEPEENTGNVSIIIENADKEQLTDEIKEKIGDRPVIEVRLLENGQIKLWQNKHTPVTITLPYRLKEGEDPEKAVVWYIDGEGKHIEVPNGRYNSDTKMVEFKVNHFSKYGIAYVEKSFSDLKNYPWAKHEIEVLAAKGIIHGTGNNQYAPGEKITRADFLTLLTRTLEIKADFETNFEDVFETDYYYDAVGSAKELGITNGTGNNRFSPKEYITRQDMIVLVDRALKMKGISGDAEVSIIDSFTDKDQISEYALGSMRTLVGLGIIEGSDKRLRPLNNVLRAESAEIMYRIYNMK